MAPDDREIILAVKNGARDAFSQLVIRYQQRVYALALRMLGDHSEADDVGQETFLRAYRSLHHYSGDSDFYTWLYRIALNVCFDHLRKRRPQTSSLEEVTLPPELEASAQDPARLAEMRIAFAKLREAMLSLPDGIRAAVVLVVLEGMSAKSAAQILGCPEGTVFWRVHEGRRRLVEAMGELSELGGSAPKPVAKPVKAQKSGQGTI
jgi:RNA polymerase sigma-70 factor, ECF subfamily